MMQRYLLIIADILYMTYFIKGAALNFGRLQQNGRKTFWRPGRPNINGPGRAEITWHVQGSKF